MSGWPRIVVIAAVLNAGAAAVVAQVADRLEGRPLAEALRGLQARGLRIVFTSATVTPDLIVKSEPRATAARQQLDEILAPHGLVARDGPAGIIQIVRGEPAAAKPREGARGALAGRVADARDGAPLAGVTVRVEGSNSATRTDVQGRFLLQNVPTGIRTLLVSAAGYAAVTRSVEVVEAAPVAVSLSLSPTPRPHHEYVSVVTPAPPRTDPGVVSELRVDRQQLERLNGGLADDPLRLVHTLPGVAVVDEFRTEFAVRGSPWRHVDFVIEGVSTQFLQHTAPRRGATGSLTMFPTELVEEVTVRAGAYPRRYGDSLGPQLDLTLREGSRSDFKLRGAVGGTNAMVLGEGPLGGSGRGSWLLAARQSYLEWPASQAGSSRTAFGFSDAVARVLYDVRPSQQIALTWLGGISNVDGGDEPASHELGDGINRLSMVNLAWRSGLGAAGVVKQRAYLARQHFVNHYQNGQRSDRGAQEQLGYRIDFSRPIARGIIEVGADIGRRAIDDVPPLAAAPAIAGTAHSRSAYAHFAWAAGSTLTLSPGFRLSASTLSPNRTLTRWLLADWAFRPDWTLRGSTGVSHQLPELRHALLASESQPLRPERATHFDAAIEHRVTESTRWQATVFARNESDILREAETSPRLVNGAIVAPERHPANTLQGTSHGIELLIDRRSATGLAGWVSYSYGNTRSVDVLRGETFWSDFDRRHALTLFGVHRLSARTSVGATLHAGSNLPIPGYVARRNGTLVVAAARNEVRLPSYVRLDLRADREFEYVGRQLRLFVEALNVLNRTNVGQANGSIDPVSGRASGFTVNGLPRRLSAGIVFEF